MDIKQFAKDMGVNYSNVKFKDWTETQVNCCTSCKAAWDASKEYHIKRVLELIKEEYEDMGGCCAFYTEDLEELLKKEFDVG